MLFGYSLGRKWRSVVFGLLIVAVIVLCEAWVKQEKPLQLQQFNNYEGAFPDRHSSERRGAEQGSVVISGDSSQGTDHDVSLILNPPSQPIVGKVTMSFGEFDVVYERAIRSHEYHNLKMGYPQFILKEKLLWGLWSKHAYIFSVLVGELSKPEGQRLEWLMWLDRDTVLMNPLVPLEMFIPPAGFEHINILTTNDRNGLNNGAFFLRVNFWSLKLFTHALSFGHYNPRVKLKYTEQSAMEEVLKEDWFNSSAVRVPQRWFNAFPPPPVGAKYMNNHARPGQLLIHFASNRDGLRPERMNKWVDIADKELSEWRVPLNETSYPKQIEEYWRRLKDGEDIPTVIESLEK